MQKYFLHCNIISILIQSICFYCLYSFFLGGGLNDMYTHKGYIFLVFIGLLLYFIPTFIASKMNKKYFLQIFLLNLFTGFTFIGWLGALIWATIKNENNKDDYTRIITIIMQIFCMLSFLCFCITDYQLFNYDTVNAKQDAVLNTLLEIYK